MALRTDCLRKHRFGVDNLIPENCSTAPLPEAGRLSTTSVVATVFPVTEHPLSLSNWGCLIHLECFYSLENTPTVFAVSTKTWLESFFPSKQAWQLWLVLSAFVLFCPPLSLHSDIATKVELGALIWNSSFVKISLGLVYVNGTKVTFSIEHYSGYLLACFLEKCELWKNETIVLEAEKNCSFLSREQSFSTCSGSSVIFMKGEAVSTGSISKWTPGCEILYSQDSKTDAHASPRLLGSLKNTHIGIRRMTVWSSIHVFQ